MTYYLLHSDYHESAFPEGMNIHMINGGHRNYLTLEKLKEIASDKIVIDMGAGTGLLGMYALKYNAKFIYFVEANTEMCSILEQVFPSKLKPGTYKIINKDIEHLTIDDFDCGTPDIAVSEFFGPRLFDEGYVNYTKHVRSIVPDILFIPETFEIDFYLTDIDLRLPIWPSNNMLLSHFVVMYKNRGFTADRAGEYPNDCLVGTIRYNANTEQFDNEVFFTPTIEKEQMIIGIAKVSCGGLNYHNHLSFGWITDRTDINKTFKIYFDEDNYFNVKKELVSV